MRHPSSTDRFALALCAGLLGCPGQAKPNPEFGVFPDLRKVDHSNRKDSKIIRPGDVGVPVDSEPLPDGTFTAQVSGIQKNFTANLTAAYCSNAYPSGLPAGMNIMGDILGQPTSSEYLVVRWVGKSAGSFTCGSTKAEPFGWSTDGSCSISVTQLDPVGGRIKGTFSGTLTRINGTGPSTVDIKGGVFDVPRLADDPSYCQ